MDPALSVLSARSQVVNHHMDSCPAMKCSSTRVLPLLPADVQAGGSKVDAFSAREEPRRRRNFFAPSCRTTSWSGSASSSVERSKSEQSAAA